MVRSPAGDTPTLDKATRPGTNSGGPKLAGIGVELLGRGLWTSHPMLAPPAAVAILHGWGFHSRGALHLTIVDGGVPSHHPSDRSKLID